MEDRIYNIGEIVSRFKPGMIFSRNCSGDWVVEVHDGEQWLVHVNPKTGPAGLFKDPLEALLSLEENYLYD